MIKKIFCWFSFLELLAGGVSFAQTHPAFNVNLQFNYVAAEQTLQLFEDQSISTQALAELRGNRIAASTTGLIANRNGVMYLLKSYLDSLKFHQRIQDDVYFLDSARRHASHIKELLSSIKKNNLNQKVVATVKQLFPEDAMVNVTIPVYVVTLGHENVEAYVRRIRWAGDTPQFVGEGSGELTIVINLAQSVRFHQSPEERFHSLLSTVAHEVFHAAFGAYKDHSPQWKRYYAGHRRPFDDLLDLTQNEGIAYYLSLEETGHGYLPQDWFSRIREAFDRFNKSAEELLSDNLTPDRASELVRGANLGGYWDSYGSMTGMFIAREIDLQVGRKALIETIALGPQDFWSKYRTLSKQDNNLPRLSDKISAEIPSN